MDYLTLHPPRLYALPFFRSLLGSLPSAYIITRALRGVDIRTVGSGNMGAVNVFHEVGYGPSTAVLVADTAKGAMAIVLAMWLGEAPWACFYAALGVVAGHNWPVFLGFRGGKGVATALGVSLAVLPWLTLLALVPTALAIVITRNVVIGVAAGIAVLNIMAVVTGQDWAQVLVCLLLAGVVTATYLGRSRQRVLSAVRQGRWLDLFSFE